jgi:hypothetical protein
MHQSFLSNLTIKKMENEFSEFFNQNWNDIKPQLSQTVDATTATASTSASGNNVSGILDGDHRHFPPLGNISSPQKSKPATISISVESKLFSQQTQHTHGQILNKQLTQSQNTDRLGGLDLVRSIYQQQSSSTSARSSTSSTASSTRESNNFMRQNRNNDAGLYDTTKLIQRIVSDSTSASGGGGMTGNSNNNKNNVPSQQNTRFNLCDTNNIRNNSGLQLSDGGLGNGSGNNRLSFGSIYNTNGMGVNGGGDMGNSSNSASTSSAGNLNGRTATADSTSPPPSLTASPPLLPPESPLNNTNTSINSSEKKAPNSIRGTHFKCFSFLRFIIHF